MHDSLWFSTRSALFAGGQEAWAEVARYREPLRRLLDRRCRWLGPSDREDLVQEILIEMQQSLAPRHDRTRGRFRALLQTVVKRRVVDAIRRRRPERLGERDVDLVAPPDAEVEALDLEGALLEAVAACRDRFTQGPDQDPDVLYALVDRLVHGKSNRAIAEAGGVSVDRVNRLLRRGRDAIFAALLEAELELPADDPALKPARDAFKRWLRQPRSRTEWVAAVPASIREAFDDFLGRLQAALPAFRGDDSARGRELAAGIALIFDEAEGD